MPFEVVRSVPTGSTSEEARTIWQAVVHDARRVCYASGRVLVRRASQPKVVQFITEGLVKSLYHVNGEDVVVGIRGVGSPLGATSAVLQQPSLMSIVAVTDCVVDEVEAPTFLARLSAHPLLMLWLLRMQNLDLHEQLNGFAARWRVPARRRLELLLGLLAAHIGTRRGDGGVQLRVPMPQCELAQAIHVTPETLSRCMIELEHAGWICRRRHRIMTLCRPLLDSLVSDPFSSLHAPGSSDAVAALQAALGGRADHASGAALLTGSARGA